MNVSPHFSLDEVLKSAVYPSYAEQQRAWLTPERAINASRLANEVLEPLRFGISRPITINSWLRCATLNSAVGGADGSQHTEGHAADITVRNYNLWLVYGALNAIQIGQRIIYLGNDEKPLWIHVSAPEDGWTLEAGVWKSKDGARMRSLVCYPERAKKQYIAAVDHPRWQKEFESIEACKEAEIA